MAQPVELATGFVTIRARVDPGFRGQVIAGIQPQLRSAEQGFARFNRSAAQATHGMGQLQRGAFAATLSVAGLRGAVLAAGSSFLVGAGLIRGLELFIGLSAEFQRSMAQFQAVTHASAAAMAEAGDEAIKLGKDITLPSTSAADAAVAMTELARGGLTAAEAMKAARGSLQLAAAAGTDFATAAQIQARALQAFGLGGDQAVRVADDLANAANVSTGDITDMAFALRQSAAVAHQVGLSIEDTTTAISLLANAGITGSDAGTSLRTMLLRLTPTTKKAREEMERLGIQTTDAAGNFLPLPAIFEQYRRALDKVGPAQRQVSLQIIFGQDAIRAATILTAAGARGFENLREAVSRHGAAAELAAAKNRGLTGSFDALRSNFESVAITVGREALPALTRFVQGLNTQLTAFTHSKDAATALSTAVGGLRGGFAVISAIVQTAGPLVLGLASAFTRLAGAIGGGAIIGLVTAYKGIGLALRVATGFQTRFNAVVGGSQAVLAGTTRVTRGGALALTEYGQAQARVVAAAEATAAAQAKATAGIISRTASTITFTGVLTGQAAAEASVRNEALKVALASGKVTQAQLEEAAAAEAAAQAWERENAARSAFARVAVVPSGVPGAGRITSIQDATQAERTARALADARREALGAALGVTTMGARVRALGTSVLGFVGGPWGALLLGITAGITLWQIFGRDGKSALQQLSDATADLSDKMLDLVQAQDALTSARLALPAAQLSRDEALVAVQTARSGVAAAEASGNATDLRTARLQLRSANLQLAQATSQLAQAERDLAIAQAKVRGASADAADARTTEVQRQVASFASFRQAAIQAVDAVQPLNETTNIHSRNIAINRKQVELQAASIRKAADSYRTTNPLLKRQLDLLAELEERTGRQATPHELRLILKVTTLTGPELINDILLGGGGPGGAFVIHDNRIGQALHNLITEAADRARPGAAVAGEGIGKAFTQGVRDAIAQGRRDIQDAIDSAKSNLLSIGDTITSLFDQAIDTGPLARRIDTLQKQLEAARRRDERQRLQEDLADARRDLARAKGQLVPAGLTGRGLNAAQQAQRRQLTQDFLQPFQRRARDASRAISEFNTEGLIANLQVQLQAQKDAVHKGIADIINEFLLGKIPAQKAIAGIAKFAAQHGQDFRDAGRKLGGFFVSEFQAQLDSLDAQFQALAPFIPGRPGRPGTKVQDPQDAVIAARKAVLQAQQQNTDATKLNTGQIKEFTRVVTFLLNHPGQPIPRPPRRNRPNNAPAESQHPGTR